MLRRWLILCLAVQSLGTPAAFCTQRDIPPNHIVSHIPRQRVESSAISAIGYSKRRHILDIEFVNGAIYRYLDVPSAVHRDLMSAESKARFYDSKIRRHYRSVLIQPRHTGQSGH
jgi:hypothetical protein